MKTNSSPHVTSEYNFVLRNEELGIYEIASGNLASQKGELYFVVALKLLLCHWHCVATVVKLSALDYQKAHCSIYDFCLLAQRVQFGLYSVRSHMICKDICVCPKRSSAMSDLSFIWFVWAISV